MISLNSTFIMFLAVVGPPKVLLAYAQVAARMTVREAHRTAAAASGVAAVLGVAEAYTAHYVTDFFHITDQSLELAGGVIFFVYAMGLVLGLHLGGPSETEFEADHPVTSGFRALLLPYVVSPLGVTAILVESLSRHDWSWRTEVAAGFVSVVAIDLICMVLLTRLFKRTHHTTLEVLSRLLGLLLAAVGVELFLQGLKELGVHLPVH